MGGATTDNSDKKDKKGRRTNKSAYTGGLVLEPKKGMIYIIQSTIFRI